MTGPGKSGKQNRCIEKTMDKSSPQGHERKDFYWEDDLLYIVWITTHGGWRPAYGLAEDIEGDQTAIQIERIGNVARINGPAGLKYLAENKGINTKHDQRIEKDPQQTEIGAAIAQQNIAFDELTKQISMLL